MVGCGFACLRVGVPGCRGAGGQGGGRGFLEDPYPLGGGEGSNTEHGTMWYSVATPP